MLSKLRWKLDRLDRDGYFRDWEAALPPIAILLAAYFGLLVLARGWRP